MKRIFAVIRKACLMEDEGRDDFRGTFSSLEAAKKYIEKETGPDDKEYFKKGDFKILTSWLED